MDGILPGQEQGCWVAIGRKHSPRSEIGVNVTCRQSCFAHRGRGEIRRNLRKDNAVDEVDDAAAGFDIHSNDFGVRPFALERKLPPRKRKPRSKVQNLWDERLVAQELIRGHTQLTQQGDESRIGGDRP